MTTPFIDTSSWDALYPLRATVQAESAGALNDRGIPGSRTWANVSGLVDLPCRLEMKTGDEIQGVDGKTVASTHEAHFQSLYAGITEKMRLVIDGVPYNILLSGSDPMQVETLLKVRKVTG